MQRGRGNRHSPAVTAAPFAFTDHRGFRHYRHGKTTFSVAVVERAGNDVLVGYTKNGNQFKITEGLPLLMQQFIDQPTWQAHRQPMEQGDYKIWYDANSERFHLSIHESILRGSLSLLIPREAFLQVLQEWQALANSNQKRQVLRMLPGRLVTSAEMPPTDQQSLAEQLFAPRR